MLRTRNRKNLAVVAAVLAGGLALLFAAGASGSTDPGPTDPAPRSATPLEEPSRRTADQPDGDNPPDAPTPDPEVPGVDDQAPGPRPEPTPGPGSEPTPTQEPEPVVERRVAVSSVTLDSDESRCYRSFDTRYFDGTVGVVIQPEGDHAPFVTGGEVRRAGMTKRAGDVDLSEAGSTTADLGGAYVVGVSLHGFITGSLEIGWKAEFAKAGTYRSELFETPNEKCYFSLVVEVTDELVEVEP